MTNIMQCYAASSVLPAIYDFLRQPNQSLRLILNLDAAKDMNQMQLDTLLCNERSMIQTNASPLYS